MPAPSCGKIWPMFVPYRVEQAWQRAALAAGFPEHTITCDRLRFRVRRLTCDEAFVHNVVAQREYLQHGLRIGPTDTVVDIGGNIGTFAVLAASLAPRGHVITVEPDPENLRLLRTNVALNGAINITPVAAAAARESGTLTLHRSAEGGGFHVVHPEYFPRVWADQIPVHAISLRDLFDAQQVDRCHFLKIDCEGAEFDLLADGACLDRVNQVAMEYHALADDARLATMRATLAGAGFRVLHEDRFEAGRGGHLFLRRDAA